MIHFLFEQKSNTAEKYLMFRSCCFCILCLLFTSQNIFAEDNTYLDCRKLASEYSMLEKSKIAIAKKKKENDQSCQKVGNKLSQVILGKSSHSKCSDENQLAEQNISNQIESLKSEMNRIIADNPPNSDLTQDCRKALDNLNLEAPAQISSGVQR